MTDHAPVSFEGRVVIVTGAAGGLGRGYAEEIARRGGHVVVNDFDTSGGASTRAGEVVSGITERRGKAVEANFSVAEPAGCRAIVDTALGAFGRIDAVIHNAGVLRNAPLDELSEPDLSIVLATHLLGGFHLTQAVFPHMKQQRYGRFVFTSSSSGLFGRPNGSNYAMAKAGLVGLCNATAIEGQAFGILANAILPTAVTALVKAPPAEDRSELADALRGLLAGSRGGPEWVTPLTVYLASPDCTSTHRYFSAVRGRYAEVFIGVAHGWMADGEAPPDAAEIAQRFDRIAAKDDFDLPQSTAQEMLLVDGRVRP